MAGAGAPGRHVHRRRGSDVGGGGRRLRRLRRRGPLCRLARRDLGCQASLSGGLAARSRAASCAWSCEIDVWIDASSRFWCASSDVDLPLLRIDLADGLLAPLLQLLELPLSRLHRVLEVERLLSQRRVLIREHLRRLRAVDELREAVRAGDDVDRARRPVHVERVEPRLEPLLRGLEVPLGHVEPVLVPPQARLDERKPVLRVLGLVLDRLELVADLVDLGEHRALVRLRCADLRGRARARHGRGDSRRESGETERAEE